MRFRTAIVVFRIVSFEAIHEFEFLASFERTDPFFESSRFL